MKGDKYLFSHKGELLDHTDVLKRWEDLLWPIKSTLSIGLLITPPSTIAYDNFFNNFFFIHEKTSITILSYRGCPVIFWAPSNQSLENLERELKQNDFTLQGIIDDQYYVFATIKTPNDIKPL